MINEDYVQRQIAVKFIFTEVFLGITNNWSRYQIRMLEYFGKKDSYVYEIKSCTRPVKRRIINTVKKDINRELKRSSHGSGYVPICP